MSRIEVTCDCCGRLFLNKQKNYHCGHCDKFFHVCNTCMEKQPKCRFCGVPLKKRREPLATRKRIKVAI